MICYAFIALNVKRNNRTLFRLCGPCQLASVYTSAYCYFYFDSSNVLDAAKVSKVTPSQMQLYCKFKGLQLLLTSEVQNLRNPVLVDLQ